MNDKNKNERTTRIGKPLQISFDSVLFIYLLISGLQHKNNTDACRLMSRSAILQPPRFVIPWETSTYVLHNDCSSAIKFPSKEMLASALFIPFEFSSSSTKTTDEQKADTVINRHTNLDDDLFLSESDKDPYASSDNSNDSDYTPSNPNSSYKQNAVNYESSSDSDSKVNRLHLRKTHAKGSEI